MTKRFVLSLFCLLAALPAFSQEIIINEFMANNSSTLTDENLDYVDWIELRNTTAASVDLTGYYLTDTGSNLRKWRFPATNIVANGYLLVYASGKDRTAPRL